MVPAQITAAVLIIGDEILSGRTADVNLNAIALFLAERGVDLCEARIVPDVEAEIVAAVNALRFRYTYVITTGGIGPTHDDITADAIAAAFGVELHEHPDIIGPMIARYGPELNAARRRMARVPAGGGLVANPVGGPPGFYMENVFVLAGVPSIMRGMLIDVGEQIVGGERVLSRSLHIEGQAEGVLAAPLEAVAKAYPNLSLGSYPFFGPSGYGANLVLRGRDATELSQAGAELETALNRLGITGRWT